MKKFSFGNIFLPVQKSACILPQNLLWYMQKKDACGSAAAAESRFVLAGRPAIVVCAADNKKPWETEK